MKKIFLSVLAVAALASCTKMDTAYEAPQEIGFVAVGNNITKAPVDGNVYPTTLNMYVNAYTTDIASDQTAPNYIYNGEFKYKNIVSETTGEGTNKVTTETNVWGGVTPYYWPNEKTLHFSGYSKSGNIGATTNSASASYNPNTDVLTINDYKPGNGADLGVNDLMWFPSTKYTQEDGYGKDTKYVPVSLYHTCSWITFMIQGDATTGVSGSSYKLTSLTMNGVDQTANVVCTGDDELSVDNLSDYVVWSDNETQTGDNTTYTVAIPSTVVALSGTYTTTTNNGTTTITQTPINIETNATTTNGGNIVVIPQKPGTIDITWTYASSTNATISDSATGLSLKLDTGNTLNWEPGKHYIYTITIKANEILIAPSPVDWSDSSNHNVTVE